MSLDSSLKSLFQTGESRKTPVWMIIPSFAPVVGGAEIQAERLSEQLSRLGWEVTVVTRRHMSAVGTRLPSREKLDGYHVQRVFSRGKGWFNSFFFLMNTVLLVLRSRRRGIYHAHDVGAPGWAAVLIKMWLGGKVVIKLRSGQGLYQQRFSSRIGNWQFHRLLRLSDCLIVVNREVDGYLKQFKLADGKVVRIPNAVDSRSYTPATAEEKLQMRDVLRLSPAKVIVLNVSRLEKIKGTDLLVKAWSRLDDSVRSKAMLVIVGDGRERIPLEQAIQGLGISESVRLAGECRLVGDFYRAADIFVLPSRIEGFSNSLIEAMACGLPIIASGTGGNPDVVHHRENGILFEVDDEEALTRELQALIGDEKLRKLWGMNARSAVLEYAELSRVTTRLDRLYRDLVS